MTEPYTTTDTSKLIASLGHCVSVLRAIQHTTDLVSTEELCKETADKADLVWRDAMRKMK